jgi:hypothetical protein
VNAPAAGGENRQSAARSVKRRDKAADSVSEPADPMIAVRHAAYLLSFQQCQ